MFFPLFFARATAPGRALRFFPLFLALFLQSDQNAPALSSLLPLRWLPGSPVPAGDGRHFRLSWWLKELGVHRGLEAHGGEKMFSSPLPLAPEKKM